MKEMGDKGVSVEPQTDELYRIKWEHKILQAKLVYQWKDMTVTMPGDSVREKFVKWKTKLAIVGTTETGLTERVDCVLQSHHWIYSYPGP
jgi:hypothetical protein